MFSNALIILDGFYLCHMAGRFTNYGLNNLPLIPANTGVSSLGGNNTIRPANSLVSTVIMMFTLLHE